MKRFSAVILALSLLVPAAFAAPAKTPALAPPAAANNKDDAVIPPGSADYSKMLAEAVRYKKGSITFEQLKKFVVAAKLPPHPLKCGYLIMPVPAPPPGVPFNPASMPSDWEHTFGEVTMTYWAGQDHPRRIRSPASGRAWQSARLSQLRP